MMKVYASNTVERFNTLKEEADDYIEELNTFKTTMEGHVTDAETDLDGLSFATWDDAAQNKFENYVNNSLKKGLTGLGNELTEGGFHTLCDTMGKVSESLGDCATLKQAYKDAYDAYSTCPKEITKEIGTVNPTTTTVTNPNYAVKEKAKNDAWDALVAKVEECNGYLTTIEGLTFSIEEDDGSGGGTDGNTSGDSSGGSSDGDSGGDKGNGDDKNFDSYSGDADTHGKDVVETTYEIPDPDNPDGPPIKLNLIISENADGSPANIAYGNDDMGYFVTCVSENGDVCSGMIYGGNASSLDKAASIITDGHENETSNGFEMSKSTYGYDGDIDPTIQITRSSDNCVDTTINVNGKNIDVVMPIPSHVVAPYSPSSLCNK